MNNSEMCSRFMSIGIPKMVASQMISQIKLWEKSCGQQWTAERLKEYKLLYTYKVAGRKYTPKSFIKMNKEGFPSGVFSYVFRHYAGRKLTKALSAFNAYTMYKSVKVTKAQEEKFFSALESNDSKGLATRLRVIPKELTNSSTPGDPPTVVEYCVNNTSAPGEHGSTEEHNVIDNVMFAVRSNPIRKCIRYYDDIFSQVLPVQKITDLVSTIPPFKEGSTKHSFGSLSGIQESGLKLRVIANPSRVIQAALEPLKKGLEDTLRHIPEDCTFDQGKSVPIIQSWLKKGLTVHSIDLSDATTLFPWEVTRKYLEKAFPNYLDYIDLMDDASTGEWMTRLRNKTEVVRFKRGQPLGLGPSFFAFSLTHHCIVRGLCEKHRIPKSSYLILGDDIAICHSRLASLYTKTMINLGCKISTSKTITSSQVAEFAGWTITSDNSGKGLKWLTLSPNSVFDFVKRVGAKGLGLLPTQWQEVIKLIAPIPKPLGGLGWSDGKNLTEFFSSDIGRIYLDFQINAKSDKLKIQTIHGNLDYHLNLFQRGFGERLSQLGCVIRLVDKREWEHSLSVRNPSIDSRVKSALPIRPHWLVTDKVPGYFPLHRASGDPRPSFISGLFVYYKAASDVCGLRNKRVEKFIERFYKTSFSSLSLNVDSWIRQRVSKKIGYAAPSGLPEDYELLLKDDREGFSRNHPPLWHPEEWLKMYHSSKTELNNFSFRGINHKVRTRVLTDVEKGVIQDELQSRKVSDWCKPLIDILDRDANRMGYSVSPDGKSYRKKPTNPANNRGIKM
uniref:Putative RNA-dependent RNA polymerase n=1 Tax=Barns Ness breadcrumb sponge narna-like virus 1 TaxID=2021863 RepID=A0A221LFL9_9VIRU|nr:putative RNA-dependent RNA polymerase [Barns Ness breadcrumb sponge narna-like virus 1]